MSINGLVARLSAVEPKSGKLGRDELLQFEGVADGQGMDLANHARYVAEIIRGLHMVFNRRDLVVELVRTDMFQKHAKVLHKAVADIASHFWRLGVNKTAGKWRMALSQNRLAYSSSCNKVASRAFSPLSFGILNPWTASTPALKRCVCTLSRREALNPQRKLAGTNLRHEWPNSRQSI